jgi:ketosteroid isomerase-like protein
MNSKLRGRAPLFTQVSRKNLIMQTATFRTDVVEIRDVEDTVREHLSAFARGDFNAWGASLAPNVFFTAADPEKVFSTQEDAVAEMHRNFDFAFDEGLQIDVDPQSLHIGVSPDGKAAWSASPLRYTVRFQGESNSFVLRHTAVLTKVDSQWSIVSTHYSLTLPQPRIVEALTGGYLPAPAAIGDASQIGAQSLFREFIHQLADLSSAAVSQDVSVFGPFLQEFASGKTEAQALFKKWTDRWGALYLRPDGIRAELTSAECGWVAANVEATVSHMGRPVRLPMRALFVYQKEQDHWSIAHAHLSVGIPDELAE